MEPFALIKRRYLVLAFVLATVLFFVRFLPMGSVLAWAKVDAMPGFSVSKVTGSVWQGQATVFAPLANDASMLAKAKPQKIKATWRFNWMSLFVLNPSMHVNLSTPDKSQLSADVKVSREQLAFKSLKGIVQAALLNEYLQGYNVQLSKGVEFIDVDFALSQDKEITDFSGELLWHAGETSFPQGAQAKTQEMKPVKAILSLEDKRGVLKLTDVKAQQTFGEASINLADNAKVALTPRLLAYQSLPYPAKAKMDQPIFEQEVLLHD